MFERLKQMLIKEFIQVLRDPRLRTVIFVLPSVQVLIIGYAVSTDVRHVTTAVLDRDNSVASRDLAAHFAESGYFDIVAHVDNERDARDLVDRNQASVVLQIHHGFTEDLRAGRTASVQVIVDGTDSNTASIEFSYATRIAAAYSDKILTERMDRALGSAGRPSRIELQTRAWFNENLESRNFFVPGVLVVVVTLASLLLTSMAVVREREIGTMEQIMVTPITPTEFILGKTVPFAMIGLIDTLVVALIGVFWFEVPLRGNGALLLLATAAYLLTTLGIGLLISTVSHTQQQAMMSVFFFFFPAMLLSGFAFPIANMPEVVQWLTLLNPLRYYLEIVRYIFLKGVGLEVLWPQVVTLFGMGALTLTLAVRRCHKML